MRLKVDVDRRLVKFLNYHVREGQVVRLIVYTMQSFLIKTVSTKKKDVGRVLRALTVTTNFRSVGRTSRIEFRVDVQINSKMARADLYYGIRSRDELVLLRRLYSRHLIDGITFCGDRYKVLNRLVRARLFRDGIVVNVRIISTSSHDEEDLLVSSFRGIETCRTNNAYSWGHFVVWDGYTRVCSSIVWFTSGSRPDFLMWLVWLCLLITIRRSGCR